jgi:hypothetical protein
MVFGQGRIARVQSNPIAPSLVLAFRVKVLLVL